MNEHDPLGFSRALNSPTGPNGRTLGMDLGQRIVDHFSNELARGRAERAAYARRLQQEQKLREALESREARIEQVREAYLANDRAANQILLKRDALIDLAYDLGTRLGLDRDQIKQRYHDHRNLRLHGLGVRGPIKEGTQIPAAPKDDRDLIRHYVREYHGVPDPYVA